MYGKIFSSLFTGSMRGKGDLQLIFVYLIANATEDGVCDFTPECISDAIGKPVETVLAGIQELEQADPMSRTRDEDGRRIVKLDDERSWGWRIVNYFMYRQIANREMLREVERLRKRNYRAKKESSEHASGTCPGQVPDCPGPHAYAYAYAYRGGDGGGSCEQPRHRRIRFDEKKGIHGFTEVDIGEWAKAYPGLNIDREILALSQWCKDNPNRRPKTNYAAFLSRNFARKQDEGGKGRSTWEALQMNEAKKTRSREAVERELADYAEQLYFLRQAGDDESGFWEKIGQAFGKGAGKAKTRIEKAIKGMSK